MSQAFFMRRPATVLALALFATFPATAQTQTQTTRPAQQPAQAQPAQAQPTQAQPQTRPAQGQPAQAQPGQPQQPTQAQPAQAQPVRAKPRSARAVDSQREKENDTTMGIISGSLRGTYTEFAAEIANVLDDEKDLRILPILGKGSAQNVVDLLTLDSVDVGIMQSDTLQNYRKDKKYKDLDKRLRYLTTLFTEEIHLVTNREVKNIQELAGQTVNFDLAGSGTAMTGLRIFEELGIKVEPLHVTQAEGLDKLKKGEIAAQLMIAGKPNRSILTLVPEDGLKLLSVPFEGDMAETWLPAEFSATDYPALVAEGETVRTLAVGAVMAVYNWPAGSKRYKRIERFATALFERLGEFQREPFHPKWRDVMLSADMPGWTRFKPAQEWLERATAATPRPGVQTREGRLRSEFELFLKNQNLEGSSEEHEELFRRFLEWRKKE